MAKESYVYTLDEWVQENDMTALEQDISCHVEQYIDDEEDIADLTRLIMISVRQELQDRGVTENES